MYLKGHFVLRFFILQVVVKGDTNIMYPEAHERQIWSLHLRQPIGHGFWGVIELSAQYDPFFTSNVSKNPEGHEVTHFPWCKE